MKAAPFKAGGALTDEHAAIYIERQADHEALLHLRAMDYLLVIEPRQQGKTSLINHLMRRPALDDVALVYVDVTTPDRSSKAAWYQTLCPRILRQLRRFVPRDQWPVIPQHSAGWREFLSDIAVFAADANRRVVIALDEIGAVTFPGATEFFSVLRDVYNSRQAETEFKRLTFLLTGSFHPRDLIKDDKISPFNIAHRVRLADFTLAQVSELVGKGIWTEEQVATLAERIHYWTDGQPYLTQLLCSYLDPNAPSADVDVSVEQLRREDENHLPPLLERLNSDDKLRKYVDRILAGERIKFYPRENRRQAQLELLGVIKADEEGYCIIRNRIYEQSLLGSDTLTTPDIYPEHTVKVGLIRSEWADKQPNFKEVTFEARQLAELKIDQGNNAAFYDLYLLPSGKYLVYAEYTTWDDATSDLHGPLGIKKLQTEFPELATRAGLIPRITLEDEEKVEQAIKTMTSSDSFTLSKKQSIPTRELNEALQRHTLALFIGADLPHEVTGLPSHTDLARELARRKGLDESFSLAEVAQRVSQAGNRWEFTNFIRNALDTTSKSPQPFHQQIVALVKEHRIEAIITTAYDNLLELAFQQTGVGFNRVVRGSDVNFIEPDRPTLIKLYGDAQQPDTLVVTDQDHSNLLRDRDKEAVIDEVRRAFRGNTVLFLGYNLADPDFRFLFDQIAESRFARLAYAVWSGLPEADVRMWRDRGIVILDVDPLGILDAGMSTAPGDQTKLFTSTATPIKETLYLNTTATLFAQWLADYTRMAPDRDFPTEKGRLVLQSIKPSISIQAPTTLAMEAFYIVQKKGEDAEMVRPIGAAITFRVIPLSSERVEVRAECNQPAVADYIRELLAEIKQRWPTKGIVSETPSARPHYLKPPTVGEKNMDYKRGFQALKECLSEANPELQSELAALEDRFWKNERAERVFGSSENTRNERAQIVFSLNELALKHCHVSFNELCQGVEPKPSVSQPTARSVSLPPRGEQAQIHFKLQIARLINLEFEVRALETPMGEPRANGRLPYTEEELVVVLKALQMSKYEKDRFTPTQRDMLKRLELLLNPRFVSGLPKRVGQALYQALMVGEVNTAFQMALNQARTTDDTVALQLRFDEDAVQLARYPWELLYHRRALLPSRAVELTRYISYPEAVTALPVTLPLQLLYIQARPANLSKLPDEEQTTVRQALNKLEDEGIFKMEVLLQPTYDALLDYLETKSVHILHFDGHGVFARQCPECGAMNYPHRIHCQARQNGEVCDQEIADIEPQGYLAFETETGHVDWISSEILGNLLYNRSLRLAVLSACRSSEVGGETLFGGIAPALIQTGVPAVVSTQLPISVDVAVKFMQGFYRALSRFESVPAAVNAGRLRVMQTREWFIPALYLRSQDDEGYLFTPTQGG
jgi:NAD-dependent SIR2 family protein deacetylase